MPVIVVGECKSRRATPLARKLTRKKRLHGGNKNGKGKIDEEVEGRRRRAKGGMESVRVPRDL